MYKLFAFPLCLLLCNNLSSQTLKERADDGDADAQLKIGLACLAGELVEKDSVLAADYLLHAAGGGRCEIGFQNIYGQKITNPSQAKRAAIEKLIELSKNEASEYQSLFLAYVGWWYDANENLTMAEKYYKMSIAKDGKTGLGDFCLGMLYFTAKYTILAKAIDEVEELEAEYWIEDAPLYHYDIVDNYLNDLKKEEFLKDKHWLEKAIVFHLEKAVKRGWGDVIYGGYYTVTDYLNYSKKKLFKEW